MAVHVQARLHLPGLCMWVANRARPLVPAPACLPACLLLQGFLKRAELREYEKERDQRLASDIRNRGRL